ncbi:MAG: hypothetical protein U1E17_01290 [Geminicoccaceae bacterium]
MRPVRPARTSDATVLGFDLFGPTCDSIDSMPGPHWLPADVAMGEWIEVGMMGAYFSRTRCAPPSTASAAGGTPCWRTGPGISPRPRTTATPALRQALAA